MNIRWIVSELYPGYRLILFFLFSILNLSVAGKLNLTVSMVLLSYLIVSSLSFKIKNSTFQTLCIICDLTLISYMAHITSIKELIILSLPPLFVSCIIVGPIKALFPFIWGILLNFKTIDAYFLADVAFASIFFASYLFHRESRLKEEQRKKQEMEKEFKEKLAIAKRLSSEFAHEIKNPLMSISAAIERIKLTKDPEIQKKMIEIAEKEIERAAKLTSEFLKLDEDITTTEEIELCEILKELEKEFWQLKITLSSECEKIIIKGNREKIKRLFSNLLRNSLEANAKNINITVKREGDYIKILIKDDGFGIDKEYWDKVFLPFFSTKKHGTGLGLAIVKRIAQLHNGDVKIVEKNTIEVSFKNGNQGSNSRR